MAKRWWLCKGCGQRWERTKQKCAVCIRKRPPARVPKHARTLRDDSYEVYKTVNETIHGISDESCGVCRKPRSQERRHDRDHDHRTGNPRGLACHICNRVMVRELTLERAQAIVDYLARVEAHYQQQGLAS